MSNKKSPARLLSQGFKHPLVGDQIFLAGAVAGAVMGAGALLAGAIACCGVIAGAVAGGVAVGAEIAALPEGFKAAVGFGGA